MGAIRVLIADDSALDRAIITDVLSGDAGICIVGEAENGREALELALELRPDLITLDLQMPEMGGLEAIRSIMNRCPTPILVLTSQANADVGFQAVSLGALEVMAKANVNDEGYNGLLYKVKFLAKVKVIRHLQDMRTERVITPEPARMSRGWIVGIAASTGGPKALSALLASLPAQFSVPVLIAQHIGGEFARGLVSFLSRSTAKHVELARHGEPVLDSTIYVAPSDKHLTVTSERTIALLARQKHDVYVPSCDLLFSSLAHCSGRQAVGVVLTGMGRDGALGSGAIAKGGGCVIVQDSSTSAVNGMPQAVMEAGYADKVLPLGEIARELVSVMGRRRV